MMTRTRAMVRAAGAAVALLSLLTGLPAVLVRAGVPFTGYRLPAPGEVLAGGAVPDRLLVDLGVAALWCAWCLVALGTAAEVTAWRGRRPGMGAGPIQPLIARLVAAVVLVLPVAPRLAPVAASAQPVPVVAAEPAGPTAVAEMAPAPMYSTVRGDSLWRIAAEQLGDGRAWTTLWALNADRLPTNNPGFICSGWTLVMPEGWQSPGEVAALPNPSPPPPAPAPGEGSAGPLTPADAPPREVPRAPVVAEPLVADGPAVEATVEPHAGAGLPDPLPVIAAAGGGLAAVVALRRRHRGAPARRPRSASESTESVPEDEPVADLIPLAPLALPAEGSYEVRVLGPVEVVGPDGRRVVFERPKAREMVVYLACAEGPVSPDRLVAEVWPPDAPPTPKTVYNTVARVRAAVGAERLLGPPYVLEGFGTDVARFRDLVAAERLGEALDLVRDRPFADTGHRTGPHPGGFAWAQTDLAYALEAEVVDVAHRAARAALDGGDIRAAQEAARAGLRASAYEERLYRDLMLAAGASASPSALRAVLEELAAVLEAGDADPLDVVDPETADLYRTLARRREATAS